MQAFDFGGLFSVRARFIVYAFGYNMKNVATLELLLIVD